MTATSTKALLGPGTPATTIIRLGLGVVVVLTSLVADADVAKFPVAIDMMIPLAAAERWLAGGVAYLPTGFTDREILPPFLYPPFVLPLLAPLTSLPLDLVRYASALIALGVAVLAMRRLAIGWVLVPFVLLWEPMFLGVWEANIQVILFAAFVATFWIAPRRHDLEPQPRPIDERGSVTPLVGWYAATVASVKATQIQAWLAILRRGPRAAVIGALPWAALALVTLPLVGTALYGDWLGQVARASDPAWWAMGPSLLKFLPSGVVAALTLATFAAALVIRGRDTGIWIGLMMLVVAPNMHDYQALFLLPAMLRIRREFALMAAFLTATATVQGWWLSIAIVAVTMLLGRRWPVLYEPGGGVVSAAAL